MTLTPQQRSIWEAAQAAEKGHWAWLWQAADSASRVALTDNETVKGEFIFQELADHFKIKPKADWANLSLLDVGCGPISLVARNQLGKTRAGVDPLRYPTWVYERYEQEKFHVYEVPFEELNTAHKFDVIVFYNALQHFADLEVVARQCRQVLAPSGVVYLTEYLAVPTNEAHIQFLEADRLDRLFKSAGFTVDSIVKPVRLPGYVERPDGSPIDLYLARLTAPA